MSTFRARPTSVKRFSAATALALGACLPAMREMRQHPQPLAGEWVDLKKTTAADTSVWRLGAGGEDLTLHVRPRDGAPTATAIYRHGIWFVRGELTDTIRRALCFNARPGRSPTACTRFALDTTADGRPRLTLREYHGTHEIAARTLVRRTP